MRIDVRNGRLVKRQHILIASVFLFLLPVLDVNAAGDAPHISAQKWSFSPPFGTFDRAQLQRGFKIYKEVCSSCHAMSRMSFRNLSQPGGPEFSSRAAEALAAEVFVQDGPDSNGDMFERPGVLADRFPSPFPNEQAARAVNGGAYPPDLSLIAKARAGGVDYLYALLVGYQDPPAHFETRDGMYYNASFPDFQIAMAPPLSDGLVEYSDGSPETVDQYARDVTAFLMWAAEPKLEARHRLGFSVIIFLIVLAGLTYMSKKKLWSRVDH